MASALYTKTKITDVPERPELCRLSWQSEDSRKIHNAAKKIAILSAPDVDGRVRETAAAIADFAGNGQDHILLHAMDCSELFATIQPS